MEINQNLAIDVPQWVTTWAKFMLKQHQSSDVLDEQSINVIEQILIASTQGDSCVAREQIDTSRLALLLVNSQVASDNPAPFVYDDHFVYLYRYWQLEQRLAQQIIALTHQQLDRVDLSNFEELLIDPHQKRALQMVSKQALNVVTGGPGTGKTYTLARIIAVLNHARPNLRVAMAAPTGKAAQRMKEALQNSLNDEVMQAMGFDLSKLRQQETLTLHRLLGLGNTAKPKYHQQKPLPYDVIVIDEASMLDLSLATMLFEAVPKDCRLILLGDANQLASIDVGSVLADLQQVDALAENRVNLVTSRRFKAGAKIGEMARFIQLIDLGSAQSMTDVLSGFEQEVVKASAIDSIQLLDEMDDIVQLEYILDEILEPQLSQYYQKLSAGFDAYFNALKHYIRHGFQTSDIAAVIEKFDDYRILAAVRHGHLGLVRLNYEMQQRLFKQLRLVGQEHWYIGRPVMMMYNDYQLGLSNGDIGICFKHRQFPDQFEVYFPSLDQWFPTSRLPKSMQTSFALSIHKSQGSEFKHAAVVLDQSATKLLSQELIYTAITRAKKVVSLLVHPLALHQALTLKTTRKSGLVNKLNHLFIPTN